MSPIVDAKAGVCGIVARSKRHAEVWSASNGADAGLQQHYRDALDVGVGGLQQLVGEDVGIELFVDVAGSALLQIVLNQLQQ